MVKDSYKTKNNTMDKAEQLKKDAIKRLKLVCDILECIRLVTRNSITQSHINKTREHINATLLKYHKLMPRIEHDVVIHLLKHLPDYMEWWGPVPCYWNFDLERFFSFAKRSMKNRRHPDAALVQVWRSMFLVSTTMKSKKWKTFILPGDNHYIDKLTMPGEDDSEVFYIPEKALTDVIIRSDSVFYEIVILHKAYIVRRKAGRHAVLDIAPWCNSKNKPDQPEIMQAFVTKISNALHEKGVYMSDDDIERQVILYSKPFNLQCGKYSTFLFL